MPYDSILCSITLLFVQLLMSFDECLLSITVLITVDNLIRGNSLNLFFFRLFLCNRSLRVFCAFCRHFVREPVIYDLIKCLGFGFLCQNFPYNSLSEGSRDLSYVFCDFFFSSANDRKTGEKQFSFPRF